MRPAGLIKRKSTPSKARLGGRPNGNPRHIPALELRSVELRPLLPISPSSATPLRRARILTGHRYIFEINPLDLRRRQALESTGHYSACRGEVDDGEVAKIGGRVVVIASTIIASITFKRTEPAATAVRVIHRETNGLDHLLGHDVAETDVLHHSAASVHALDVNAHGTVCHEKAVHSDVTDAAGHFGADRDPIRRPVVELGLDSCVLDANVLGWHPETPTILVQPRFDRHPVVARLEHAVLD
mmetsp:Transcript_16994/g.39787  ORF Transcript_16994/g.39787 Transcript_16994/m.39787 type:complete len:243 (+) Transcript_16994:1835-2563(+)